MQAGRTSARCVAARARISAVEQPAAGSTYENEGEVVYAQLAVNPARQAGMAQAGRNAGVMAAGVAKGNSVLRIPGESEPSSVCVV